MSIRCVYEHMYSVYLNTSRASSFCKQPLIPAAVGSGFSFTQKSCPPLPANVSSGPLPRSQELGERCPRAYGGGDGTNSRNSGAAGLGPPPPAGCQPLSMCLRVGGFFLSSVHSPYSPLSPRVLVCRWLLGNQWFKSALVIAVVVCSRSVESDSVQPRGLEPTGLLCPWDFPGKNTGVGCHFLLQGITPTQG